MSIAPSLFSSDETHCCASKRQENICCTHVLFLLLDYQVHTRQQCPGIPILTLEHLQDTAEKRNATTCFPRHHHVLLTLDAPRWMCSSFCASWLLNNKKSLQNSKLSELLSTALLHNTPHCWGSTPGWHLQQCPCCHHALGHFPQGNSFL